MSIALPFLLGIAVAFAIHGSHHLVADPNHPSMVKNVNFLPFALFIGASMSVTAFPVLARILTERGLYRTPTGAISLACAAVDDAAAWSLLAVVLVVVSSGDAVHIPLVMVEAAAFVAFMLLVVRPWLARIVRRYEHRGRATPQLMAVILVGVVVSSFVTERIGLHQIFGPFLFGLAMPKEEGETFVSAVTDRLDSVGVQLLLPLFFVITGFSVNLRAIGLRGLGELTIVILAAIGGKFSGAFVAARINALPTRRAAAIGTLMNTRGLTELVILSVGLSFGILDRQLFGLLVVMALVTTVMTEPLLRLVYPERLVQADLAQAERGFRRAGTFQTLAVIDDIDRPTGVVDTAADLAAAVPGGAVVLSHFLPRPPDTGLRPRPPFELGQMADLLERLKMLCQHRPDVAMTPAALFTDDLAHDILAQAGRLDVDAIVMSWPAPAVASRLRREARCDLVFISGEPPPGGADLVAAVRDDDDAPAVIETAGRLAASRGVHLLLTTNGRGSRRIRQMADRLQQAGIACVVSGADDSPSTGPPEWAATAFVVTSDGRNGQPPVRENRPAVLVHGAAEPGTPGWQERLGRLRTLANAREV
jgi:Kef-type K+ transport system membrane component KefB